MHLLSRLRVSNSGLLPAALLALCVSACAETSNQEEPAQESRTSVEPVPETLPPDQPVPGGRAPAEPAVSPRINAYYEHADVDQWREIFERTGREVFERRFEIVKAIGVYPGMTVADVGAGTGFYTMLFARAVGDYGKVYAVDISESFVADIERRAREYRVDNVEAIVNDQKDTGLPEDSVDLVFLCDTYHHFEYPRTMLGSIARALREDGELVLIDFRRIQGVSSPWVMSHVRANRDEVTMEVQEAGFELVEELDLLRANYVLRFRKKHSTDDEAGAGAESPIP
jgi:ubiquinone/menaquinone biosynthesis C-methylase UbiE